MDKESQRLRYTDLAPEGLAALRALEHYLNTATLLDPVLLELVRLLASHLNGCGYCVGMHSHELQKHNETPDRIAQVDHWRGSTAYTHRERAAFAWTETITNIQQGHAPQSAYDTARQHFTEVELTNLTLAIVSINAWNRMAIAFRAQHTSKPSEPQEPKSSNPEQTEGDGGKVAED